MIGKSQLRAARALLDLSQKETAEAAGVGLTTLIGVEAGNSEPSHDTLRKLQDFFEGAGVEFIGKYGVSIAAGNVTLKGTHGIRRFFDDVYDTARHGTHICIFNGVPEKLVEWAGEGFYNLHSKRMSDIKDRIKVQVIVKEGEQNLIGSGFAQYRSIPEDKFHERTIYVYGDKVAFLHFEFGLSIEITQGKDLADSVRALFGFAWENAQQ